MGIPVSYLIDDAALGIGDPNKTRVKLDEWVLFYNQAARRFCEKANVLRYRWKFDLNATAEYPDPAGMTVMTKIEVTQTPENPDSWSDLKEMFEDEFREHVAGSYPTQDLPTHYFKDADSFFLIPRPVNKIVLGGRVNGFGLPDRVFDVSETFVLPLFTQDYVSRRMQIYAKVARNRLAEAAADLREWDADMEMFMDKVDDRSRDRVSSIAPRKNRYAGMR